METCYLKSYIFYIYFVLFSSKYVEIINIIVIYKSIQIIRNLI